MKELYPLAYRFLRLYWRITRPITVGVSAIVLNSNGEVLLIRPSYKPGWHFPGGGVKRGEDIVSAIRREVREETGIECLDEKPKLVGVFSNQVDYKHDHVILFLFRSFKELDSPKASLEISESRFCALNNLPNDLSPGVRRRLSELSASEIPSFIW